MPSRTPTTLSLLAAALLALAGCAEEEDVSPNFEDRIPPGLEFEAADRVLEWGDDTSFSGQLTQGEEKLAGETVTLEADTYPFEDSFRALETAQTDDQGNFEFGATPDANTSFRVAYGELSETESKERRVYVEPRTSLEAQAVGSRTRFTTVFRHPEDRSIQGSTLFSYAASAADAEATGELQFIRVDKVDQLSLGLSEASIQLPLAEDDIRYSTCVVYRADAGLGAPNEQCSQSSVPAD
ncbi:MAG: hypothetical protein M3355_03700 [Actinomycetota bacterium]|nr:hypothetical protein [Actinomycetota bacterium]